MHLTGQVLVFGDTRVGHPSIGKVDDPDLLEAPLVEGLVPELEAPVGQVAEAMVEEPVDRLGIDRQGRSELRRQIVVVRAECDIDQFVIP